MKNMHTIADSDSDDEPVKTIAPIAPIAHIAPTESTEPIATVTDAVKEEVVEETYKFKSKRAERIEKEKEGFVVTSDDFPVLGNNITKKKKDIIAEATATASASATSKSCWSGVKKDTVHEKFDTKVHAKVAMPPAFRKKTSRNVKIQKEVYVDNQNEYWDESDEDYDFELNPDMGIDKYDHH